MNRSDALKCAGWFGASMTWTLVGGLPVLAEAKPGEFSFVQISDSHLGFQGDANPDVAGTFAKTITDLNALPQRPAFVVHTGDVTHLAKPAQFALAKEIVGDLKSEFFAIPGEHDVIGDKGALFHQNFGHGADPWWSMNANGAHFVFLVNVLGFAGFAGMGDLGNAQLSWLANDLASVKSDSPLIIFAHVPLFAVYPEWGWTTADAAQALTLLRRFSSVTVLNGHIHQIQTAVEGSVRFYTARPMAYPLPAPGSVPHPAPMTVAAADLPQFLGYREIEIVPEDVAAIDDHTLG